MARLTTFTIKPAIATSQHPIFILTSYPPKLKLIAPFAFFKYSIIFSDALSKETVDFLFLGIKVGLRGKDFGDGGTFFLAFEGIMPNSVSFFHIISDKSKLLSILFFL